MSNARVKRAERIVGLRAGVVERLEVELGQRLRATAECEKEEKSARDAWEAAVAVVPQASCSSADLSENYEYRMGLMRKVEVASALTVKARAEEEAVRAKLRSGKTELKKIETWRDRLVATGNADEAHRERKAADEVAARIARNA